MDCPNLEGIIRIVSEDENKYGVYYTDTGFSDFEDLQECLDFVVRRLARGKIPLHGILHQTKPGWNHYGPDGVIPTLKRFAHENNVRLPENYYPHIDKAPSLS